MIREQIAVDIEIMGKSGLSPEFQLGFKRRHDGKVIQYRTRTRLTDAEIARIRAIMTGYEIVSFNGNNFDIPLIFLALQGATVDEIKEASSRIINGKLKYWETPRILGIDIPRLNHIDLIEPQPNAWASLKMLNGRLHGQKMQDLPYHHDAEITDEQFDEIAAYNVNDLDATLLLLDALEEPLKMREAIGAEYGMDFRSKSDAQIGEAIIRKRSEEALGRRIEKVDLNKVAGTKFRYQPPDYLQFETEQLRAILERIRETDFFINYQGKVSLPDWLGDADVIIGDTRYQMGIGGLHSTEKNRSVYADDYAKLFDFDVASYYPAIILGSGLFPQAIGPVFLDIYRKIREERIIAKREGNKVTDQGLKIALNGTFGKMGSVWSILYAPHLMIAVTLTGQLALLMLIERAEQVGIPVVSANTDGVVFRCPRHLERELFELTRQWESDTGFELESTEYLSLHSQSVNTYIAIKPDGKAKRKGVLANPRAEGDLRTQMMNSPSMNVCADAAVAHILHGTPVDQFIRECRDVRDFVTVVQAKGGATWRDEYLGKVVRFTWSTDGDDILYSEPHPETGNFKKVSRSDGSRPLMELPDEFPDDIDYSAYVRTANEILLDVGYLKRPPVAPKAKVYSYNRRGWLIASIAA
ncbi:hypothetical protein [Sphingopyxis sp. GW247-27LB]|uniref:hypothetical protein n=1 Tax=Sphingopyxis sp. GW247-27LB TaxID=2012632 RepID=UPI000BA533B4|nr:hypothetical protein [Sphingopyxis sp. GW247-27LB]PAL23597.1 hypothetical protein CD928_05890 [Sphingopyxis sp. GW247-27LB]